MATKTDVSPQTTPPYYPYNNQNDTPPLGPRKTIFVLATVVACIAILFPKIFYPMMFGGSEVPIKNNYISKDLKSGGKLFSLFLNYLFNSNANIKLKSFNNETLYGVCWLRRMLRSCFRSWKVRECYSASWSSGLSKTIKFDDRGNKYVNRIMRNEQWNVFKQAWYAHTIVRNK